MELVTGPKNAQKIQKNMVLAPAGLLTQVYRDLSVHIHTHQTLVPGFVSLGAWICQLGAWNCLLGVWICLSGARTCLLGAWTCLLGVWICLLGAWTCLLGDDRCWSTTLKYSKQQMKKPKNMFFLFEGR